MAYDPSLSTATDRVRFAVQDADDAAPLLPEATYTALIAIHNGVEKRATIAAAEALLARFAQRPDEVAVEGAVRVKYASRLAVWRTLAEGLRVELEATGAAGGTMVMGRFVRQTAALTDEFGG